MPEPVSADGQVLLRQRPISDRCDYLAEKLAAHLEPGTMPHEAYVAVGAAIVNLSAIGTEVRALLAALDAATVRAERAEAALAEHEDEWGVALSEGDTSVNGAGKREDLARRSVAADPERRRLMHRRGPSKWRDADTTSGCLCPHSQQPDGTLTRDGVLAVGCPVHDPDAGGGGGGGDG